MGVYTLPSTSGVTALELQLLRKGLNLNALNAKRRAPRGQEVAGRVSVVVPTSTSRSHFHEQMLECWAAQDADDKELVIVEAYDHAPSEFLQKKAAEDEQIVLFSYRVPRKGTRRKDYSVGVKRNMTLALASGEVIVNFDDDDIYADTYASSMTRELQRRGLVALTLSSWHNFFVATGQVGVSCEAAWDEEEIENNLYGFGFSYVHRRKAAMSLPYPDVKFAEDLPLMQGFRRCYGPGSVGLKDDVEGIVMHIVHATSTTVDPDFIEPLTQKEVSLLTVSDAPVFQDLMARMTWSPSVWVNTLISFFGC